MLVKDDNLKNFIVLNANSYIDAHIDDYLFSLPLRKENNQDTNNDALLDKIINDIVNSIQSISINASSLVAINYINHIFAFSSIVGGTSCLSSLTMNKNDISYNFNVLNFNPSNPITITDKNWPEYYQTYNYVWTFESSK